MRDIKGYEGYYAITSCGKVWSYRRKQFLKPRSVGSGYLSVMLCVNGSKKEAYVHRLVAEAYIPNPDNLPQVNHLDENKTKNNVNNLEWCSAKYNANYGTRNERMGKHSQKPVRCIETGETYQSVKDAAAAHSLTPSSLSAHLRGVNKTFAKLHWEYIKGE